MSDAQTDEELALRVADDDKQALEALYQRHSAGLEAFLSSRMGGSESADVAQEVWLRVFRGLQEGKFSPPNHFRAWLYQIARNMMLDSLRRSQLPVRLPTEAAMSFDESFEKTSLLRQVAEITESLPETDRELIQSRLAGTTYKELGERLGVSENTLKKRWHRVIKKVRDALAADSPPTIQAPDEDSRTFSVYIDPGDAPQSLLSDLLTALSVVYRSYGGSGLKISSDEQRVIIGEMIE